MKVTGWCKLMFLSVTLFQLLTYTLQNLKIKTNTIRRRLVHDSCRLTVYVLLGG